MSALSMTRVATIVALLPLVAGGSLSPAAFAEEQIPAEVAKRLEIGTVRAEERAVVRQLELVGTVTFDEDLVAVVGPRLPGRIVKLSKRVGEPVQAGEHLAEIESVDLARAQADYLGTRAKARAAAANAERERDLARRAVSSRREREVAEAEAQSLEAQAQASMQLLLALGVERDELARDSASDALARYRLHAPIGGIVVERNGLVGEAVATDRDLYRIADLSRVRVELSVFERDLAWVHPGLVAEISAEAYPDKVLRASVRYIDAQINRDTRRARVYLDVDNPGGLLLPGKYVTARLASTGGEVATATKPVVVPKDAVQILDGHTTLFVKNTDGSFTARAVELGTPGSDDCEIRRGLASGEEVALHNAFLLKSEVLR